MDGIIGKKIHKRISDNAGFSILELTISLFVFGIIIIMISNIVILNIRVSTINRARTRAREESGFILKQIKRDIRNSSKVKVVKTGGKDILFIETDSTLTASTTKVLCWMLPNVEGQIEKYELVNIPFDSATTCGGNSSFKLITKMPANILIDRWSLNEPKSFDNAAFTGDEVKQIIIQIDARVDLPIGANSEFRNVVTVKKVTIIATRNFIVQTY